MKPKKSEKPNKKKPQKPNGNAPEAVSVPGTPPTTGPCAAVFKSVKRGGNDSAPIPPPVARLTTIHGVRQHLSWAIKEVERGTLDVKVLNALSMGLNVLAGLIVNHDLEERIEKLEKRK